MASNIGRVRSLPTPKVKIVSVKPTSMAEHKSPKSVMDVAKAVGLSPGETALLKNITEKVVLNNPAILEMEECGPGFGALFALQLSDGIAEELIPKTPDLFHVSRLGLYQKIQFVPEISSWYLFEYGLVVRSELKDEKAVAKLSTQKAASTKEEVLFNLPVESRPGSSSGIGSKRHVTEADDQIAATYMNRTGAGPSFPDTPMVELNSRKSVADSAERPLKKNKGSVVMKSEPRGQESDEFRNTLEDYDANCEQYRRDRGLGPAKISDPATDPEPLVDPESYPKETVTEQTPLLFFVAFIVLIIAVCIFVPSKV